MKDLMYDCDMFFLTVFLANQRKNDIFISFSFQDIDFFLLEYVFILVIWEKQNN